MCFYDQILMTCGDHKWGHFRQHCSKEYRTGETCGMRLPMHTYAKHEKCKICQKLDTKHSRLYKEKERIERWQREQRHGTARRASIEAAESNVETLEYEISQLEYERELARRTL